MRLPQLEEEMKRTVIDQIFKPALQRVGTSVATMMVTWSYANGIDISEYQNQIALALTALSGFLLDLALRGALKGKS